MRQSFESQPALFAPRDLFDHPALAALDAVERLIDWSRIEALLPRGEAKRPTGRPGYPAQTLFRALLLGLWYDLSDVRLSQQLARDLLFRKFCRRNWIRECRRPRRWAGSGPDWRSGWRRCWRWWWRRWRSTG